MKRRILVIAAHPDDEVLGCGGTIADHVQRGDEVHIMLMGHGLEARGPAPRTGNKAKLALAKAAHRASEILGAASLAMRNFPDNRMDTVALLDVVREVEAALARIVPDTVYTHHCGDVNIDHRRIHEAVVTACRPLPGQPVKTLLFCEVSSSTEWQPPDTAPAFVPNWFVDVSNTLETKCRALEAYASEMRAWPHARSIEAVRHLARWRGATVGIPAAEAFVLGRQLAF